MNGTISKTGATLTVRLEQFSMEVVNMIKEVPGRRYAPVSKTWRIPLSTSNVEQVRELISKAQLEATPQVSTAIQEMLETKTQLATLSRLPGIEEDVGDTRLARALRPFQRVGVIFARKAKRCMIADEMGLGKTIQALATVEAENAFPCIVVCPASLKLNWEREARKWLDGKTIRVLNGRGRHVLDGADILIANYDIVSHGEEVQVTTRSGIPKLEMHFWLVEALLDYGIKSVILDESHYIKNMKAKRTKACHQLCKGIDLVLLLTGTPILNRPIELVSQLRALGVFNQIFGTFKQFADRYCAAKQGYWGVDYTGATNLEELNQKLRARCLVRRKKSEVLKELPAKTISHVYTDLSPSVMRDYKKAESNVVAYLETIDETRAENAQWAETLVQIEVLKQLAVKGKLSFVKDWVKDFLESGEKLVLFGTHTEALKSLAAEFKNRCAMIIGETSMEDRQKAVDLFQDPGSPIRLIICNMKAGGVGLTLTAASNVAFFELGWTPADHEQAEDRCHRIGQTDSVTAYYLLARGTIDESIMELLNEKRQVVNAATDGRRRPFLSSSGGSIARDVVQSLIRKEGR